MKSMGLCLGASNVSLVIVECKKGVPSIEEAVSRPHGGNPRQVVAEMVDAYYQEGMRVAITGRKFKSLIELPQVSEPESVELAYGHLLQQSGSVDAIVSAGGETFLAYQMGPNNRIANVYTGNKCASGTGEFFLQQIRRMDLDIEQAIALAQSGNAYRVAGRCSVFCKSDCTHALNKGESKDNVVAGLCRMMGGKIVELLQKFKPSKVMVVGGASQNTVMIEHLKHSFSEVVVPKEASHFEALGAALYGLSKGEVLPAKGAMPFKEGQKSFSFLPDLSSHLDKVSFKEMQRGEAQEGDSCVVGLDVGSTTTKAIVMRRKDRAMLASVYLRTNGDPVEAARQCYLDLSKQVPEDIEIIGLGVTGSGRQIAGLHALTEGVINEIIAHAAAAVHFDPQVDTIFEIGGQDAKYTYITNRVPSDYAMNEACSAGTGSFLEEAASETMGVEMTTIAKRAMSSKTPPNFNDQCAAFIGSDIKTAIHEGLSANDILAGLVYSICMNYLNRVKGSRPVGKKIFMQGGVCYNQAVPVAMAALMGREIVVPPEPGLMGAYGVALDINQKINLGLLEEQHFNLRELAHREVVYEKPFVCRGGTEGCDRKCTINLIKIDGKNYPFGGACNRFDNIRRKVSVDTSNLDLVKERERIVFNEYGNVDQGTQGAKTIGLTKSLLTNTLYPLYAHFFAGLGLNVKLVEEVSHEDIERCGAAFCYPVELGHGMLGTLLKDEVDIVFSPHVKYMYVEGATDVTITCPFVQAEPYYRQSAFSEMSDKLVLSPVLDFSKGYQAMEKAFVNMAKTLDISPRRAKVAYAQAVKMQHQALAEMKRIGAQVLKELEADPEQRAVVLFGRPYNAFVSEAHMGIPHKFASRGQRIIPCDFLPLEDEETMDNMYWAMGQVIIKATRFVQRHPQLYGVFITNFSCGPDSFVVSYFRNIMGQKPSLTLELDNHTADAGIDTRIEAFLDVVNSYQELQQNGMASIASTTEYKKATTEMYQGRLSVIDSSGQRYPLTDSRVKVLIPSMGDFGARSVAAVLQSLNINAQALPAPGERELQAGLANSSCKECLPLQLTLGSFINYMAKSEHEDEVLIYFMPDASGPCRFGQYNVLLDNYISKNRIANTTTLSLTSENSYAGLKTKDMLWFWHAVVITEIMDDIRGTLMALASDRDEAMLALRAEEQHILEALREGKKSNLLQMLEASATRLANIPLHQPLSEAPKVLLVGEIYVRSDSFSRHRLVERLADKGIVGKVAPVSEWLYYIDYMIKHRLGSRASVVNGLKASISIIVKRRIEEEIKEIFRDKGVYELHLVDVSHLVESASNYLNPQLTGEGVLTVGAALVEIVESVDGVISLGPFGCMPGRIAEAILMPQLSHGKRMVATNKALVEDVLAQFPHLPLLAIESDGKTFPPLVEAKLESFYLQVGRLSTYKRQRAKAGRQNPADG